MQFDEGFLAALNQGCDASLVNTIHDIVELMRRKWHCYSEKGRNAKAQECVDAFLSIREVSMRRQAWSIMYTNQRLLEYIVPKLPQRKLNGELFDE